MEDFRSYQIQNYLRVVKSNATQMSVIAPTILDFGRIVLNFYFLFFHGLQGNIHRCRY